MARRPSSGRGRGRPLKTAPRVVIQNPDNIEGTCSALGCERILRRNGHFITLVGDVLVCGDCHLAGFPVVMPDGSVG